MDREQTIDLGLIGLMCNTLNQLEAVQAIIRKLEITSLDTLLNIIEQYQCCSRFQPSQPLSKIDFPDVQRKLLYKLSCEIEQELDLLQSHIYPMETCGKRLEKCYDSCLLACQRGNEKTFDQVIQRSYKHPAISEVLEGLDDIRRLVQDSYHCKQHLLNSCTPDITEIAAMLGQYWSSGDAALLNKLEEIMAMCACFKEAASPD